MVTEGKIIGPKELAAISVVAASFPGKPVFIMVGMVIPTAIQRRLSRGQSLLNVSGHVLLRTLSLLIIGVFMVNMGVNASESSVPLALWSLLAYLSVIAVWRQLPKNQSTARSVSICFRLLGIAALVALASVYRVTEAGQVYRMRTMWWGILGLIGWAYLTTCIAYLITRGSRTGMLGVMALLFCVFIGDRAGIFATWGWIKLKVDLGSMIGSLGAITCAGAVLGLVLLPTSSVKTHAARLRWAICFGAGMAVGAILLRPSWGISKVRATPSWCLWGSAWSCWVWALLYWLIDMKGWKGWAKAFSPAGENPLMAYILAPLIYSFLECTGLEFYSKIGHAGFWPAFLRGVVFAFAITWLTGLLRKIGLRLGL